MRYTTIIDITKCQELYKNHNVRLIYMHLVLVSGYHDNDRDIVRTSIRILAADTGISISAVRHAIRMLERWQMLIRHGNVWTIRKWCQEQPITTRPRAEKNARRKAQEDAAAAARRQQEAKEDEERRKFEELTKDGRSSYELYISSLETRAAAGDVEAIAALRKHKS